MKRLCGILAALLAANSFLCAQDFAPSEQVLSFIRAGQGDSVYARCNATMRNALTPQQLSTLWAGLERQFGTLQKAEAWEAEDAAAGYVIHMRQLQFRNQPIKAILSWNDNLLAGLYFRAVEATAPPTALQSDAEGIDFEVQTGKILLPGTLLLPKKTAEKPPCIILVHGSGPADRDETVGPTPFFRQLADSLAAAGIATLRYEKRTRVYGSATRGVSGGRLTYDEECVDDALTAIAFAAQHPEVDASRIYVLGHSLGGMLMPRILSRSPYPLGGGIALAPPARKLPDLLRDQLGYISSLGQLPAKEVEIQVQKILAQLPAEYLKADKKYSPTKTAARLRQPLLLLFAGNDYQVTKADADLWQSALRQKANATVRTLPALNHLFAPSPQVARPEDYQHALAPSPETIRILLEWIAAAPRQR